MKKKDHSLETVITRLSNGEMVVSPWIIYSKKMNVVFCFLYYLFSYSKNKTSFTNDFNDQKYLYE